MGIFKNIISNLKDSEIVTQEIKKKTIENQVFDSMVLKKALLDAKKLKTDLLEADYPKPTDSKTAMYRGRIFSISGKDKRFPILPKDIEETDVVLYPFLFGVSDPMYCKKGKEIEYSNRPFLDDRSAKEKKEYREIVEEQIQKQQNELDYKWILSNLPDIAPKSLSGYVRMKNSNSANYQKIKKASEEKGYLLK